MRRPYYGWIVVAACFLGSSVVFGLSYAFGVFFEPMLEEFGRPRGVTSTVFGIQTLAIYLGATFLGPLVDRYGTRRLLAGGTALLAAGFAWTSQAGSLVELILAWGVVTGIALGVIFVVSYATVPRWFDRRLGLAAGLASAGLGIGMLVVAPTADWLIDAVGWRLAFRGIGVGAIGILLIAIVLIRDDPTSTGHAPPPEELAYDPGTSAPMTWGDQLAAIRSIAFSRTFASTFIGWVLIYTTMYVTFVHIVVFAGDIGLGAGVGAIALALIGGASTVGRISIGHLADYFGRLRTFAICSSIMGVATISLTAVGSTPTLLAFAVVFGLAYGGNGALLAPLTADLFGRRNLYATFGLISMAFAVSGLLSPPLAGAGFDRLGTYDPIFATVGLAAVAGAAFVLYAGQQAGAGLAIPR